MKKDDPFLNVEEKAEHCYYAREESSL